MLRIDLRDRIQCLLVLLAAATATRGPLAHPAQEGGFTVRFVDDRGVPLEGLEVGAAWMWETRSSTGLRTHGESRRTDRTGAIVYAPVARASGRFRLTALGDEWIGHATEPTLLDWDGKAGEQEVVIPRLGRLRGRVTGPLPACVALHVPGARASWRGEPVGGFSGRHGPPMSMRTAADGAFELDRMTPGTVEVVVRRGDVHIERTVDVPPGGASEVEVFDFESLGGWITGTVVGPDGAAAEGVAVDAVPYGSLLPRWLQLRTSTGLDWRAGAVVTTDADGRFALGPLASGAHEVIAPLALEGSHWGDALVVLDEGAECALTLQLAPTRTVDVRVTNPHGVPLADVQVEMGRYRGHDYDGYWVEADAGDREDGLVGSFERIDVSATTDADGRATFRHVPPRELEVTITSASGSVAVFPTKHRLGAEDDELVIALEPGALSVQGGAVPAGARRRECIALLRAGDPPVLRPWGGRSWTVRGERDGGDPPSFDIIGVPLGEYVLGVSASRDVMRFLPVHVGSDEPLVLDRAAFAEPIGARVRVLGARPADVVTTHVNGVQVNVPDLCAPAVVDVLVQRGSQCSLTQVTIAGPGEVVAEPQFRPGATILAGFEVDGHATAMPMALVHESGFRFESKEPPGRVDPAGTIFIGVPPGSYEVFAGDHGSLEVVVGEGDDVVAFVKADPDPREQVR